MVPLTFESFVLTFGERNGVNTISYTLKIYIGHPEDKMVFWHDSDKSTEYEHFSSIRGPSQ